MSQEPRKRGSDAVTFVTDHMKMAPVCTPISWLLVFLVDPEDVRKLLNTESTFKQVFSWVMAFMSPRGWFKSEPTRLHDCCYVEQGMELLEELNPNPIEGSRLTSLQEALARHHSRLKCSSKECEKQKQNNTIGGGRRPHTHRRAATWTPTARKVVVKGKKRTVYRNSLTGELRVKKMVAVGGTTSDKKKARYFRF